jgi:hypothetical protein
MPFDGQYPDFGHTVGSWLPRGQYVPFMHKCCVAVLEPVTQ